MRSIWSVSLSLLSGLGLIGSLSEIVSAGDRHCAPCFASVPAAAAAVPVLVVETRVVEAANVVASENQALLVLNCPTDARVTIGGRLTHAAGSTRQYRLRFDGGSHICPVEIRIRDNDEKATYRFETTFDFHPHQRAVLSMDRSQMERISDTHPAEEMAKLLKPGTLLKVTDDGKLESFPDPDQNSTANVQRPEKKETASPLNQTIEHQTKLLDKKQSEEAKLTDDVRTKTTRREAAGRIRKQTEDAYQIKIAEVNAAINDSSVILAGKRLEAKKLELELNRAREVEQEATNELGDAQHLLNDAKVWVRDADDKLKETKWRLARENQKLLISQERNELQRLEALVKAKTARFEAAVRLRQRAEDTKDEADISLAREVERRATRELAAAKDQSSQALDRINQAEQKLARIIDKTIPLEAP